MFTTVISVWDEETGEYVDKTWECPLSLAFVKKTIALESGSIWARVMAESETARFSDEFREARWKLLASIEALESLEAVNAWLLDYRRLSLHEWVTSL